VSTGHDENGCHTAEFTTPTGARHHSKAPPQPGPTRIEFGELEVRFSVDLANFGHAA
jgi:hypothetical protein